MRRDNLTSDQLSLFNHTAEQLRDRGMAMALEHAEEKFESWGDRCYELLKQYIEINNTPFMAEFFRQWTEGKIEDPPTKRAFGSVFARAARYKLITLTGYAKTTNYKAHRTPAAVWIKTTDNQ